MGTILCSVLFYQGDRQSQEHPVDSQRRMMAASEFKKSSFNFTQVCVSMLKTEYPLFHNTSKSQSKPLQEEDFSLWGQLLALQPFSTECFKLLVPQGLQGNMEANDRCQPKGRK